MEKWISYLRIPDVIPEDLLQAYPSTDEVSLLLLPFQDHLVVHLLLLQVEVEKPGANIVVKSECANFPINPDFVEFNALSSIICYSL